MNNEAHFGVSFAVKNAKQVQRTMDSINAKLKQMGVYAKDTGNKIDKTGKEAEKAGKKGNNTLDTGTQKANKMANSLGKVAKKWLSVAGAITLVSMVVRRAFSRIDELTGLNRMAKSAGVAESKIYSLGKALKKTYGADASSAASAYTSLSDILGGARAGRGISEDVVKASARYGIALNGGMLSEDQLMTNIAKAMYAQRKQGNMYGVRDIASAFGIDEAMMLHLSERGANWDRGLPAANLKQAQEAAERARNLQAKWEEFVNKLIDSQVLDLIVEAMQGIVDVINWLKDKFNIGINSLKEHDKAQLEAKNTSPQERFNAIKQGFKNTGMGDKEATDAAVRSAARLGIPGYQGLVEAQLLQDAHKWADYYNQNMDSVGASRALNNVNQILSGVTGASAYVIPGKNGLQIEIIDKAGVLRNTYINATSPEFGSVSTNVASPVK